ALGRELIRQEVNGMKSSRLLLITALALTLVVSPASAQVVFFAGWNYSMPTVKVDDVDVDIGNRSGFNIGVLIERGDLIGYAVGASYSQKGFNTDTASVKLGYIEFPAMLSVGIPFVRAYGGVNIAFEMDCQNVLGPAPGGIPFTCENDTESFDFGLRFGVRGKLLMFSASAFYTWSTTDVWSAERGSIKNRVLQLGLGVSF
ncbi:MAG TPA: outer membrane beta-barrel protein, partial [Gemmatimonadota bacterium]|nr:outer membrane beta-barrel protein [Gemmatimonadota bacterium]